MRIIIATTGRGGHLFCGLSIAKALRERVQDIEIYLLGSHKGGDTGFRFYKIYVTGSIISQVIGMIQSGLLYLFIRPHAVVSTGGFASFGIVFWSWLFNKPCIIHEQNLVPGKANRLSAYFADKILVSFEDTMDYFKKGCILTGMPIRFRERIPQEEARRLLGLEPDRFTVLVMGGSYGAHRINQIVADMLERLPRDLQFIHLTGTQDLDFVKEAYKRVGFNAYVEDFSTRMAIIYSASNLVIGRAGSGMLSEITFFGLPAILIPYPHSQDRHQYKNAEFMQKKGAAVVLPEDNASSEKLLELINSRDRLKEMARNSAGLAAPGAVDKIVDEIMELINA